MAAPKKYVDGTVGDLNEKVKDHHTLFSKILLEESMRPGGITTHVSGFSENDARDILNKEVKSGAWKKEPALESTVLPETPARLANSWALFWSQKTPVSHKPQQESELENRQKGPGQGRK